MQREALLLAARVRVCWGSPRAGAVHHYGAPTRSAHACRRAPVQAGRAARPTTPPRSMPACVHACKRAPLQAGTPCKQAQAPTLNACTLQAPGVLAQLAPSTHLPSRLPLRSTSSVPGGGRGAREQQQQQRGGGSRLRHAALPPRSPQPLHRRGSWKP